MVKTQEITPLITNTEKDNTSVAELAKLTKLTVTQLSKILKDAGIDVQSEKTVLSAKAKSVVLEHLRPGKGRAKLELKRKPSTLSLTPKSTSNPVEARDQKILSLDKKFRQTDSKKSHPTSSKEKPVPESVPVTKAMSVKEVLATRAKEQGKPKEQASSSKENKAQSEADKKSSPKVHVTLPDSMSVDTLAKKINKPSMDIIKTFFELGEMVTVNQMISFEQAEVVLDAFNITATLQATESSQDDGLGLQNQQPEDLQPRAAIVTIMGHVDHGKTSLLDYIRKTKVVDKEAGGITQHIGAYQVHTDHGDITFLDTPGHEAFTAMRARGADITDIVILVVAANDGVMPQTIEAISHAKAAKVPIIVAVNKIDKDDADPEKIRTELSKHDVLPESWGGDVIFQDISAKTGANVDKLLDSIALQAEMMELKADVAARPAGTVIETRLDKGLGTTATIIVTQGRFKQGQIILAGEQYGRIRMMRDSTSQVRKTANPSDAIEITGLSSPPRAGDQMHQIDTEKQARDLASSRHARLKLQMNQRSARARAESMMAKQQDEDVKVIPVIIKADVHGSLEALSESLQKCSSNDEHPVSITIVASSIGGISSSDIHLAKASDALIIAFNVRCDPAAKKLQIVEQVNIEYFTIIYDVIDAIKERISGICKPKTKEITLGSAIVKDIFRSSKFGTISGCEVQDGLIKRNALARIIRDQKAIYDGRIESLRRFSDIANEVKSGLECGIGIKGYSDVKVGDIIEAYHIVDNT